MKNLSRSSLRWVTGGIFLFLLVIIFITVTKGDTKLKVTSPDGRFVAYGIEAPAWMDITALLIPPLQGQTGCRFVVTDTRSGRTRQLFASTLSYDGIIEMATTPRAYNIFWSPDSTTVVCTIRAERHGDPKYDELYWRVFAVNKANFTEVPAATSWIAEYLFHELLATDATRHTIAEQLINESNSFNEGVGHLALWCAHEADTTTLEGWGKKVKDFWTYAKTVPDARLAEYKPHVRWTVLNGKPKQYQDIYVRSAWNAKGLFLSVRAMGELQSCSQQADILQNGCSAVRVRLSRDQQTSSKEYVFARVNGRSTTLAAASGKALTTSKNARCSICVSAPTTGATISDGATNWWLFIPWSDFGVLPEDVRSGGELSFAMTIISATTLGTAKTEWFPGTIGNNQGVRVPSGKVFLMP